MNSGKAIFKNPVQDRLFILVPPVLAMLAAFSFAENSQIYLLLLVVVSIFDSGHVYITLWRTWWNTALQVKPKSFWTVPLAVFLLIFFWNYLELRYLWSFIVYFTVYHNVRQLYGINKWYQMLEEKFDKTTDYFLYGVCGLSFFALHFKPDFHYAYYTGHDLFVLPNAWLFSYLKAAVLGLFFFYLAYELLLYLKNRVILLNRFIFVVMAMLVYMASCLWATNALQLLAPLILTHALHYLVLIVLTGAKTNSLLKTGLLKVTFIVLLSLLVFGGLEYYAENNYINILSHTWLNSVVIGLYLTPLLTHFILDSIIWKQSYPEFREFLKS